jgi:hypothetical protein
MCKGHGRWTNRNLKVHKLLGEGAHLIIEAELVFANLVRCEDEIALPLLLPVHDDFVVGAGNLVVHIKGAARLYLVTVR